jgi:hypothetical protein
MATQQEKKFEEKDAQATEPAGQVNVDDEQLLQELLEQMALEQAMAPPEQEKKQEGGSDASGDLEASLPEPAEGSCAQNDVSAESASTDANASTGPNLTQKYKLLHETLDKHRSLGDIYLKRQDQKTIDAFHRLDREISEQLEALVTEMKAQGVPVPDAPGSSTEPGLDRPDAAAQPTGSVSSRQQAPKPQRTLHQGRIASAVSNMPADAYQHVFPKEDQQYILFMFSHLDGHPKSSRPCFMLGPVAASRAEIETKIPEFRDLRPNFTLMLAPMRTNQIVTMEKHMRDREYLARRMSKIVELHKRRVDLNNRMFQKRIEDALALSEEAKQRKGPVPEKEVVSKVQKIEEKRQKMADQQGYKPRKTDIHQRDLQRRKVEEMQKRLEEEYEREGAKGTVSTEHLEISGAEGCRYPEQLKDPRYSYAVVIIVLDQPREGPVQTVSPIDEFVFHVLQCFEQEEEAQHYAVHFAGKQLLDFEPLVVPLYEWIDPFEAYRNLDQATEEGWHPQLTDTLNKPKIDRKRMEQFQNYCKQAGLDLPVTEIHPDGTVKGKDAYGEDLRFKEHHSPGGEAYKEVEGLTIGRGTDPTTRAPVSLLPSTVTNENESDSDDEDAMEENAAFEEQAQGHGMFDEEGFECERLDEEDT